MSKDIVLIPGALATPKLWQQQENHFQGNRRFHHVDTLDSDSITAMAHRFAANAPDKFTLIGFSMGGYIALELFRIIPDRVKRLILINSAAKTLSERGQLERERSLELINNGKFDFLIQLIFKNSIHDKNKQSSLLPLMQAMAHEVGVENYKKQLTAILNKADHLPLLSTITCPTLIIAAKQDKVMPTERSEHLAKNIKNAELIYLNECGHLAMLEQPDVINNILADWL